MTIDGNNASPAQGDTLRGEITATFRFNRYGQPTWILLNAETESDQAVLQRALNRLVKPQHVSWLKRIVRSAS